MKTNPLLIESIAAKRERYRAWRCHPDRLEFEKTKISMTLLMDRKTREVIDVPLRSLIQDVDVGPNALVKFAIYYTDSTAPDPSKEATITALVLRTPIQKDAGDSEFHQALHIVSAFTHLYFEEDLGNQKHRIFLIPLVQHISASFLQTNQDIIREFFLLGTNALILLDPDQEMPLPEFFYNATTLFLGTSGIGLNLEDLVQSINLNGIDPTRSRFLDLDPLWIPPEDQGPPSGGEFISLSKRSERREVLNDAVAVLLRRPYLFSFNDSIARITGKKIDTVDSESKIQSIIAAHAECFETDKSGRIYRLFPDEHARVLLNSGLHTEFRHIDLATDLPILGKDFEPVELGYCLRNQTYRFGEEIEPSDSHEILDEILSEFSFRDPDTDRTHLIATLLTSLIHHHFPGSVPFLLLLANQRGVGKSLLALIVGIVREGKEPMTVTFNPNDEELEKRLCSVFLSGARTCILDNVKVPPREEFVSSQVLERSLTDPKLSFRILSRSQNFEALNNAQFLMTSNGAALSPDLISRSLTCQLHFDGNPATRNFKKRGLLDFVKQNRMKIISELLGMFAKWRHAGSPRAQVSHRFLAWAELIGGVLEANGFHGFLRPSEVSVEIDPDLQDFFTLAESAEPDVPYSSQELLKLAGSRGGIFTKIYRMQNERGRSSEFGKLMSRFIDSKAISIRNTRVIFQRSGLGSNNASLYIFRSLLPEAPEASREVSILDLRRQKSS
jgi:hypothetical protein